MNPIEDYIARARSKQSRLQKLLSRGPNIKSTRTIASPLPKINEGDEKILRPSKWLGFLSVLPMLPIAFMFACTTYMLLFKPFLPPYIIAPPFCIFLLYIACKYSVFNKSVFYTMILNSDGITARENNYLWKDIAETAIEVRSSGKNSMSYLMLFNNDHTVTELSLYCFSKSDSKMARYIEFYKNKVA